MAISGWVTEHMKDIFSSTFILGTIFAAISLQLLIWVISTTRRVSRMTTALKDFPIMGKKHWLYGNLNLLPKQEKSCEFMRKMVTEHPTYLQFWLGPTMAQVRVGHPEGLQAVCKTAEPKSPIYRYIEPWIGKGLLTSEGKKWARARRLLTPAFHFDILRPYVKVFSKSSLIMMDKWRKEVRDSDSQNMFEHVSLMTLDSILKCAFTYGSDVQHDGKDNPYINAVYTMTDLVAKRFRRVITQIDFIYYNLTYNGYRFRKACATAHNFSRNVINARRKSKKEETDNQKRKYLDFLDILLDAKDTDGNGLTDEEIQNEVDTFMFEGHDTTASGISWCLYNLACHPEYQEKCRKEVNQVLGDRNEMDWDDMSRLPVLTMCIKESLRTHPPVVSVGRELTNPITFPDGKIVPAGCFIGINIYSLHHNPTVWDNPQEYRPERFTPENSEGRSPHAFIPFSAGPRNCIGQQFAMVEMKTAVGLVLKNFQLSVDESKPVVPVPELILRAKGGLWLHATPLN